MDAFTNIQENPIGISEKYFHSDTTLTERVALVENASGPVVLIYKMKTESWRQAYEMIREIPTLLKISKKLAYNILLEGTNYTSHNESSLSSLRYVKNITLDQFKSVVDQWRQNQWLTSDIAWKFVSDMFTHDQTPIPLDGYSFCLELLDELNIDYSTLFKIAGARGCPTERLLLLWHAYKKKGYVCDAFVLVDQLCKDCKYHHGKFPDLFDFCLHENINFISTLPKLLRLIVNVGEPIRVRKAIELYKETHTFELTRDVVATLIIVCPEDIDDTLIDDYILSVVLCKGSPDVIIHLMDRGFVFRERSYLKTHVTCNYCSMEGTTEPNAACDRRYFSTSYILGLRFDVTVEDIDDLRDIHTRKEHMKEFIPNFAQLLGDADDSEIYVRHGIVSLAEWDREQNICDITGYFPCLEQKPIKENRAEFEAKHKCGQALHLDFLTKQF